MVITGHPSGSIQLKHWLSEWIFCVCVKLDAQIQDTTFSNPALFRREGDRIPVQPVDHSWPWWHSESEIDLKLQHVSTKINKIDTWKKPVAVTVISINFTPKPYKLSRCLVIPWHPLKSYTWYAWAIFNIPSTQHRRAVPKELDILMT